MLVSVVQHLVCVDQVLNIVATQERSIQVTLVYPMLVAIVVLSVVELAIAVRLMASMLFFIIFRRCL